MAIRAASVGRLVTAEARTGYRNRQRYRCRHEDMPRRTGRCCHDTWFSLGSHSQLTPSFPLQRALQRRGRSFSLLVLLRSNAASALAPDADDGRRDDLAVVAPAVPAALRTHARSYRPCRSRPSRRYGRKWSWPRKPYVVRHAGSAAERDHSPRTRNGSFRRHQGGRSDGLPWRCAALLGAHRATEGHAVR